MTEPKTKAKKTLVDENDLLQAGMQLGADDLVPADPQEPLPLRRRRHLTDLGNALRLLDHRGADLHWVPRWKEWIAWDRAERVWVLDESLQSRRWAQDVPHAIRTEATLIRAEAADAADDETRAKLKGIAGALDAWAHQSEASGKITAILKEAQPHCAIDSVKLDANPELFTCRDAAIELAAEPVIRAPQRADLVTRRSLVEYGQGGHPCPEWCKFLRWAMCENDELVAYLQRAIGYSLTGDRSERAFFFMHGAGSNGKSTFISVFQKLMGGYSVVMPPKLLLEAPGGQERHPTEIARLEGSRVVLGSDQTSSGARWNESLIKELTGEAATSARGMNENFRDIPITWKLWLASNNLPYASNDPALWRRVQLIPWLAHVDKEKEDRSLERTLLAELPGILCWAIAGLRAWREQGLAPPQAVEAAVAEYRSSIDLVGQWLEDRCERDSSTYTPIAELHADWVLWARGQGILRPMAANSLGGDLGKRGFTGDMLPHVRTRIRRGLRLLPASYTPTTYNRELL